MVNEFWIPPTRERADLAVIGDELVGYEIKSPRDSLKRLPRQVEAFSRVFDRCTAVLASRHLDGASMILPAWWGIMEVPEDGPDELIEIRPASLNANVDSNVLVRLLWRDEVFGVLSALGLAGHEHLGRHALWHLLVRAIDAEELRVRVRDALLARDPSSARIPTRRFRNVLATAA